MLIVAMVTNVAELLIPGVLAEVAEEVARLIKRELPVALCFSKDL